MDYYDEIEIEEMLSTDDYYYYPCPCGDIFKITKEDIENGEEIARCDSCALIIKVIY